MLARKYAKYACVDNPECGVASPERPTSLVEGDRYDTSVVMLSRRKMISAANHPPIVLPPSTGRQTPVT